jgi:hypothetical protein
VRGMTNHYSQSRNAEKDGRDATHARFNHGSPDSSRWSAQEKASSRDDHGAGQGESGGKPTPVLVQVRERG